MAFRIQDQSMKPTQLQKSVRQGDFISPKLFDATLGDLFEVLDCRGRSGDVNGEYLTYLRFADDTSIEVMTLGSHQHHAQ